MITYAMNICICGISMCITDLFKVGSEKIRTAPLDPSVARWYKCRAASVNGPPLSFSARRACNSPCIDSLDKIWSMLATSPSTARVQKVPSCLNSARLDQPWPACHRTSNSRQIEVSYSCCSNKLLETAWSINLSCCWIRHVMRANDWEPECKIICQGLQRDIKVMLLKRFVMNWKMKSEHPKHSAHAVVYVHAKWHSTGLQTKPHANKQTTNWSSSVWGKAARWGGHLPYIRPSRPYYPWKKTILIRFARYEWAKILRIPAIQCCACCSNSSALSPLAESRRARRASSL